MCNVEDKVGGREKVGRINPFEIITKQSLDYEG